MTVGEFSKEVVSFSFCPPDDPEAKETMDELTVNDWRLHFHLFSYVKTGKLN